LLVNAYPSAPTSIDQFYQTKLSALSISGEVLPLFKQVNGRYIYLAPDNRTQSFVFKFFKNIIWYGNDIELDLNYAQNTLIDFFNDGGNILFSSYVASSVATTSPLYAFTPIERLVNPPAGYSYLLTDTSSVFATKSGYPNLKFDEFSSVVKPMVVQVASDSLYRANILQRDQFNTITSNKNINAVVGIKRNSANNSRFVLSTLEIHKMDNASNILPFFDKILKTEFGL
jgi:hypothetical protein